MISQVLLIFRSGSISFVNERLNTFNPLKKQYYKQSHSANNDSHTRNAIIDGIVLLLLKM
jgi:hypothetical protein